MNNSSVQPAVLLAIFPLGKNEDASIR